MVSPGSPQIIGRYRVYGRIGAGGMATVHLGRVEGAAGFSRTVAIKRLHPHLVEEPEFIATMVDEARLAARIRHPNVVPTLDVVSVDGELLVVMEYVPGEALARLLRAEAAAGRRTPLPIVSAIAIGVLHGLHAAHEAKSDRGSPLDIVHRDVSPQNVLVGTDGVARVIDFGVAKAAGRMTTTRDGVVKGKLSYMAPEQLGSGQVSRRADVYSMSVVLWEMLTGRRMLSGAVDAELIGKIMAGVWEPPTRLVPELAKDLDTIVLKGLAKDPEDRFASAREMADTIMRAVTPAFSTDVGAWVEETARESLAKRETLLAEMESRPGIISSRPSDTSRATRSETPDAFDQVPTTATQASSLSVETPRDVVSPGRSRAFRWIGTAVTMALLVGGTAAVIGQSTRPTAVRPVPAASTAAPVETTTPSQVVPERASAATAASAVPSGSATTSPPPASLNHGRGAPRSRTPAAVAPAPKASDSLVFTRPD